MQRFLISCLPAMFLMAPHGAGQGVPSRARVVDAEKVWRFGGDTVERGDRLPADGEKVLTAQGVGTLTLDCGAPGWFSYFCRTGRCRVAPCASTSKGNDIDIRQVDLGATGFALVAGDHLRALFEREPKTSVMAVTRSAGGPSDALLLENAQGIHFGGALTRVLEGQYCFRLVRLPPKASQPPRIFTLNWDRAIDAEGLVRTADLAPGTYLLEKGTPNGSGKQSSCALDPEDLPAWVVIASENRFARAHSDWNDKQTRLDRLERSGASAALVTTLRHAVLSSISESVEAP